MACARILIFNFQLRRKKKGKKEPNITREKKVAWIKENWTDNGIVWKFADHTFLSPKTAVLYVHRRFHHCSV